MNLVNCVSDGNGNFAVDGLGEIKTPVKISHKGTCLLGIRPESVVIQDKKTAGSYPLKLELVEELGAGRILHTRLGNENFTVHMPHTEELPAKNLFAKFPQSAIHLFDPDSGGRIQ